MGRLVTVNRGNLKFLDETRRKWWTDLAPARSLALAILPCSETVLERETKDHPPLAHRRRPDKEKAKEEMNRGSDRGERATVHFFWSEEPIAKLISGDEPCSGDIRGE